MNKQDVKELLEGDPAPVKVNMSAFKRKLDAYFRRKGIIHGPLAAKAHRLKVLREIGESNGKKP